MSEPLNTLERTAIAVTNKRDVTLTMPWFASSSKYPPRAGNVVQPLINGQRAFEAVHQAIQSATKSIDIISWGFDPSMRLIRPGGERIGTLLERKARAGVEVRILIWKNALANFGENNIIGDGVGGSGGGSGGAGSGLGSTSAGGAKNSEPDGFNAYGSKTSGPGSAAVQYGDPDAKAFNRAWFNRRNEKLAFRTRDFSSLEKTVIEGRHIAKHGIGGHAQRVALSMFPSHHQKMILVDYELPDQAIGFVMGHNMLRNYWDADEHSYHSDLRLGFPPWQDLSTRVLGPVLFDLNENFCTAWQRAQPWIGSTLPISQGRLAIRPARFEGAAARRGAGEMAQICRTQPQENDRSILESYKLGLSNARNYIYVENQYFRNSELALLLRSTRRKLKSAGWRRDFYVFVVTNVPDKHGRLTTYEMLEALGQTQRMPQIEKKADQLPDEERALRRTDLEGMNIVICTLQAFTVKVDPPVAMPSSSPGPMGLPGFSVSPARARTVYRDIYVHSKLMLVDDVFFTLGSANVNVRSMEVDSELNISMPSPMLTKQWREKLWRMHTGKPSSDAGLRDFRSWTDLSQVNRRLQLAGESLTSTLVEFYDGATSGSRTD